MVQLKALTNAMSVWLATLVQIRLQYTPYHVLLVTIAQAALNYLMVIHVHTEPINPTDIESISMSVFLVLLVSTVNFLDKQMPQVLVAQDTFAGVGHVLMLQMTQVMLTTGPVLLDITARKGPQMAPCAQKELSDPTLVPSLAMIVYHVLEESIAFSQVCLLQQVTVLQDTTVQLKKTFAHHILVAFNAQQDITVQMAQLTHTAAIQGPIKKEFISHHAMFVQRVITAEQTLPVQYLAQLIITVQTVPIHQLCVLMERSQM